MSIVDSGNSPTGPIWTDKRLPVVKRIAWIVTVACSCNLQVHILFWNRRRFAARCVTSDVGPYYRRGCALSHAYNVCTTRLLRLTYVCVETSPAYRVHPFSVPVSISTKYIHDASSPFYYCRYSITRRDILLDSHPCSRRLCKRHLPHWIPASFTSIRRYCTRVLIAAIDALDRTFPTLQSFSKPLDVKSPHQERNLHKLRATSAVKRNLGHGEMLPGPFCAAQLVML